MSEFIGGRKMKNRMELYIDGEMVDIPEDIDLTLEIRSNFLTDIDQVECNRSWMVTLPKTVRNMEVMGLPDRLGCGSEWKHQYHECELRKNGVPVVTGARVTVDECEDGIALTMYWGVFKEFETLKEGDITLKDIVKNLYVPFTKSNKADEKAAFLFKGYGYADYNEMRLSEESEEWKGWSVSQYKEAQEIKKLLDGKIRTGEELDVAVGGDYETDDLWKSLKIPFAIGSRAQVNGVAGYGEYRAYALLDKNMKVVELASVPTKTIGGDLEREEKNKLPWADYYYLICVSQAITMKKIRLKVKAPSEEAKIEWGVITQTGTATSYGEVTVKANFDGILEWDAEKKTKPLNQYVYLKQSKAYMMAIYAVTDATGTFGGYREGGDVTKNPSRNICVEIEQDISTPLMQYYMIEPTFDTAWLIVNADMRYSRSDAAVKVFGKTLVSFRSTKQHAIQPSVTVNWLMGKIKDKTGVEFVFPESEKALISSLAVPIIDNKSDENTWNEKNAEGWISNKTELGMMRVNITKTPDWMDTTDGIKITQPCTVYMQVTAYVDISTDGWKPSGSDSIRGDQYITSNDYIRMVISNPPSGAEDRVFIIGASTDASTAEQFITATANEFYNGKFTRMLIGDGNIDLNENDEITFELCNDEGTHKALRLYNGSVQMTLEESEEVPYGGNYPIGKNLPDIKVVDFIKFLNLLTGTFPRQMKGEGKIEMAKYDTLEERTAEAYDWSDRLIPAKGRNTPRNLKFIIGEWCRHNVYKWKQDAQTREKYDGDLQLDCDTMEYTRDVWELPFAASDKDRIPIRTSGDGSRYPTTATGKANATYQYAACEPRVMNIVGKVDASGVERAALTFNIDLNKTFKEKYGTLTRALRRPNFITEWLYLSNVEIMGFDETKPVYLKQYGQYFIVTRMSVQSDGKTEAEMIQLNI